MKRKTLMDSHYIIKKVKQLSSLDNIDEKYLEDIEKLADAHNKKLVSLYGKMPLLAEQIKLEIDRPYYRIMESLKYGKDSSSLEVYILKYGEIEGRKRHKEKNNKTSQTLDSFINKYGKIDGPIKFAEYKKTKSMSLDMCIKRHGEIEGPKIYKEYWETTGFGTNTRAFKVRHGDDYKKYQTEFRKKQGFNNTLSGKILKYGEEEGSKRYKELNDKKSKSLSKENLIQKLLNKNIPFAEIQEYVRERWDNVSLKSFCLRYGEDLGLIKYNDHIKKMKENSILCIEYYNKRNIPDHEAFEIISKIQWERNNRINFFSKESLKYLNAFNKIFMDRGYSCQYKHNEYGILLTREEFNLYKQNRMYFYDFYVPDLNIIIEYHGVLYHSDIDYDSTLGVTKEQMMNIEYNKDFHKKWLAEQRGNTVCIIRSWKLDQDLKTIFDMLKLTEGERCIFI